MRNVFCFGTFDILHAGHEEFFKDIKKQGENLIVIVVPDKVVYQNKGRLPKNNQEQRIANLKGFRIIDKVLPTIGLEETYDIVAKDTPCIFAFGYDQNTPSINKFKKMLSNKNVKFYTSKEFAEGIHTSNLNENQSR